MPDWEYKLWNEDNFDVNYNDYTREAYDTGKFAFVSDVVRLYALYTEGGLYLDVDFEVYKSFESLLSYKAFAGFEGSKHSPLMMGVCASEPHGEWASQMLNAYKRRSFLRADGSPDLTTNVQFITGIMATDGFKQDGSEQDYKDLHIFPVDYFCPMQTSGEYIRTGNTYCEHRGLASWGTPKHGWKARLLNCLGQKWKVRLITLKRTLLG